MSRKYPAPRLRIELYATEEDLKHLEILANEHGLPKSAYLRSLIRREWRESPFADKEVRVPSDIAPL